MRLRLFLPLLLVCAAGGYVGGALAYARWGDRPHAPKDPAAAADAREWVDGIDAATREAKSLGWILEQHATFRERYPDSWLHAYWAARR